MGVAASERQMEAVEPAGRPPAVVVDDVDLAAQDRLDPVLTGGGEQLDGPVHHPVVGQASAGWSNDAARAARSSMLHAPSSSEYSEWT